MKDDDKKYLLLTVSDAFNLYPKQCKKVLKKFGYIKEDNNLWLCPADEWLYYDGAGIDISYCCSDNKWITHADLLMCSLYCLINQYKNTGTYLDLNELYNVDDPLKFVLDRINIKDEEISTTPRLKI